MRHTGVSCARFCKSTIRIYQSTAMHKKTDRTKGHGVVHTDPEAQQRHLRRQLDSLERDNHQSLNDLEGFLTMAIAAQKDEDPSVRKTRHKVGKANLYSSKTNLNILIEDAHLETLPPDTPSYLTCNAAPSNYPPRHFCSVCGFSSNYKCLRCGMKYCSVQCLGTHQETRCLKWTA
ncbi:uncharacterized protein BYT42DRAFT_611234 [Radiomyces spectabilis]|uniref:uncharacterized protein n=1 Tax=Radiomyces spectabilis TaxID=64574 RepID=UPI002220D5FB|nr:uncharacterized protein BYT42DRAFT_611234 [Radiomyces spectabilis]KAI8388167.1 hypothetical protein BYT42DRAFT_611234 [Radiomyces spectabilis]